MVSQCGGCVSAAAVAIRTIARLGNRTQSWGTVIAKHQHPDPHHKDLSSAAKIKTGMVQVRVCSMHGGTDKTSSGHRHNTIPAVNGMIRGGMSCQLVFSLHEGHAGFSKLASFHALILPYTPNDYIAEARLRAGLEDTYFYHSPAEFELGCTRSIAFQPRID